jgi:hypothetical protein
MSERQSETGVERLRKQAERAIAAAQGRRVVEPLLERIVSIAADGSEASVFAHRHLAEYRIEDHPWRALLHLRKVVGAHPDDDVVHALTGLSHALLANFRAAVSAYRRALALAPRNPWYHHNLGHLLDVALDQPGLAVKHLEFAHRAAHPPEHEIAASLAHCLARTGKIDEARELAGAAVSGDPRNREHKQLLAWIERGAPEEAGDPRTKRRSLDGGPVDRGGAERDRGGVDRGGVDRGGVDRGGVDRGAGGSAQRRPVDRSPSPRSTAGGTASERGADRSTARSSPDRVSDRAGGDRPSLDRAGTRPGAERPSIDRRAGERQVDRSASDRGASDRGASDRSASDRSTSDRSASDRSASDRSASDRSASDRSASDRGGVDGAADRAAAHRTGVDHVDVDREDADRADGHRTDADGVDETRGSVGRSEGERAASRLRRDATLAVDRPSRSALDDSATGRATKGAPGRTASGRETSRANRSVTAGEAAVGRTPLDRLPSPGLSGGAPLNRALGRAPLGRPLRSAGTPRGSELPARRDSERPGRDKRAGEAPRERTEPGARIAGIHDPVVALLERVMREGGFTPEHVARARRLWADYEEKRVERRPERAARAPKPDVCAAAIEYAIARLHGLDGVTRASVARRYGVGARSVSERFDDIQVVLALKPDDPRYARC